MGKFPYFAILFIFIIAVMLVFNTALLHLLYGIDLADQLDALTSLAVAGSFPGQEAHVADESAAQWGEGEGQQDKSGVKQNKGGVKQNKGGGKQNKGGDQQSGTRSTDSEVEMTASRSGEKSGANGQNCPTGEPGEKGDDYFIKLEEIGFLENMSLQDKLKAVSILSGVDRDVLDSAIQMAGDGITFDEYNELMDSAKEYLNLTDIKTLEDILNRNGSLYAQGGR